MNQPTAAATTDPWDGANIPTDHLIGGQVYPFVQWWNGQAAFTRVHPVLGKGGWAIPVEQVAGIVDNLPEKWELGELPHKDGSSTPAYLVPGLWVAVIATRFTWVVKGPGGTPMLVPAYTEGAKGKVNALVVVKGLEAAPLPFKLTLSGMAGKAFQTVIRDFRQQVITQATAMAKRPFPTYAFWMGVKAGPVVQAGKAGQQSPITPPVAAWHAEALQDANKRRDHLRNLFVGQGVIDFCAAQWEAGQEWAAEWKKAAHPGGEMPDENGQLGPDLPPPDDEEIPF